MYNLSDLEVEEGGSQIQDQFSKIARTYLKTKMKAEGLRAYLNLEW
jgi:hypothetical protein